MRTSCEAQLRRLYLVGERSAEIVEAKIAKIDWGEKKRQWTVGQFYAYLYFARRKSVYVMWLGNGSGSLGQSIFSSRPERGQISSPLYDILFLYSHPLIVPPPHPALHLHYPDQQVLIQCENVLYEAVPDVRSSSDCIIPLTLFTAPNFRC